LIQVVPKLKPNIVTYNTLIDACHRSGNLDAGKCFQVIIIRLRFTEIRHLTKIMIILSFFLSFLFV